MSHALPFIKKVATFAIILNQGSLYLCEYAPKNANRPIRNIPENSYLT